MTDLMGSHDGLLRALLNLADTTPELFYQTFGVNARGTFFTVQKALPLINDGGAIVLVSSVAGLIGPPG